MSMGLPPTFGYVTTLKRNHPEEPSPGVMVI